MNRLLPDSLRARVTALVAVTSAAVAIPSALALEHLSSRGEETGEEVLAFVETTTWLTVAVLVASVVFAAFVAGRITAPIAALREATQELSAGHLERRVMVQGTSEVRALAGAFNEMAARLEVLVKARYRSEGDLRRARNDAVDASRMKSRFLATMSHEIRTPMNGVIGMAALLRESHLDPEQREFADTIHESAQHLLSIINDILDFSKGEAGKLRLLAEPFELRPMVEGVVDLVAPTAQARGLEVVCALSPSVPEEVVGDVGRLRQILTNLVGNAVKFTERGEIVLRTELEHRTPETVRLRFSVRDTGIGIPQAAQKNLFLPFVQADDSTSRRFGGTGLGIAISKQLVEAMHGRIRCDSTEGVGSVFSFTVELGCREPLRVRPSPGADRPLAVLVEPHPDAADALRELLECRDHDVKILTDIRGEIPFGAALVFVDASLVPPGKERAFEATAASLRLSCARVILLGPIADRPRLEPLLDLPQVSFLKKPVRARSLDACLRSSDADRSADLGRAPAAAAPRVRPLTGPRVLVAEDNMVNQRVAQRMLERLGIHPTIVDNGKAAVEAVAGGDFDIVFMDVQMPQMDGYEATAEIRKLEARIGHVRIYAMTANALQGDRDVCIAAGMDDYVAKPVTFEALESALERWSTEKGRSGAA